MERNGTASSRASSGEAARRRRSRSDVVNGAASPPSSKRPTNTHKRSLSGSILARLPFLGSSFESLLGPLEEGSPVTSPIDELNPLNSSGSMANALWQTKTRKRKGSLRRIAVLGTGKSRLEGRERRSSSSDTPKRSMDSQRTILGHLSTENGNVRPSSSPTSIESLTPRPFSYSPTSLSPSDEASPWLPVSAPTPAIPAERLSTDTLDPSAAVSEATSQLLHHPSTSSQDFSPPKPSPMTSPTSNPYGSTTDDDDPLTMPRRSSSVTSTSYLSLPGPAKPLPAPYGSHSSRRRNTSSTSHPSHRTHAHSPLSRPPSYPSDTLDEWDYTETERWGWVVLITTWIVFVVGMGSCLGVWSWAWDVGETPYAPPELEDDPTLPIVGYYPALGVMTGIMAWIWVVVAWVGMKYFRHAKVVGEEG